jgi:hypothetical protein
MRLYVPLQPDEIAELQRLALRERRTPQQQAALLLGEELERRTRDMEGQEARGGAFD